MTPRDTLGPVQLVTLAPDDGGLACQVVSTTLTVCRRLPAPLSWGQVALWVVAGAVLVTLWGTALLFIEARHAAPRRRATDTPLPEAVPFIHFPQRAALEGEPLKDNPDGP